MEPGDDSGIIKSKSLIVTQVALQKEVKQNQGQAISQIQRVINSLCSSHTDITLSLLRCTAAVVSYIVLSARGSTRFQINERHTEREHQKHGRISENENTFRSGLSFHTLSSLASSNSNGSREPLHAFTSFEALNRLSSKSSASWVCQSFSWTGNLAQARSIRSGTKSAQLQLCLFASGRTWNAACEYSSPEKAVKSMSLEVKAFIQKHSMIFLESLLNTQLPC